MLGIVLKYLFVTRPVPFFWLLKGYSARAYDTRIKEELNRRWLIALSQVLPHLAAAHLRSTILAFGLRAARAVLEHSGCVHSAARHTSERRISLAGIGAAGDVPIARRLMVRREAGYCLARR